jgi:hypothetical protein
MSVLPGWRVKVIHMVAQNPSWSAGMEEGLPLPECQSGGGFKEKRFKPEGFSYMKRELGEEE